MKFAKLIGKHLIHKQSRRNSLRAASFGPPTVSFVLAIARTCIRQAPPTFRGRGLATSAVTDCLSARNHHQCITYLHNCKSPRIAITALWGLYILKSKCQRRDIVICLVITHKFFSSFFGFLFQSFQNFVIFCFCKKRHIFKNCIFGNDVVVVFVFAVVAL